MSTPKNTGKFGKGNPGKPKGAVSKVPAEVKDMILTALTHAGGAEYLFMQAFDNPKAFMALLARVIPLQVNGAGENGEHLFEKSRPLADMSLEEIRAALAQMAATGGK